MVDSTTNIANINDLFGPAGCSGAIAGSIVWKIYYGRAIANITVSVLA